MLLKSVKNGLTVKAYQGDAKTLLAFDMPEASTRLLAGFSIACIPGKNAPYYLYNTLHFKEATAADKNPTTTSSLDEPIQKFRWLHIPGNYHQKAGVFYGDYTYQVTPRYFGKNGVLTALDASLTVSLTMAVQPFKKGNIELGFSRGFVQSQAFAHHFGADALIKPQKYDLSFNTGEQAGKDNQGIGYTFSDEYAWSGFTAREKIFALLNEVVADKTMSIDVFAYDFNEPDIIQLFLQLAGQGRIRMILDNAPLHHGGKTEPAEDKFETAFNVAAKQPGLLIRGHFTRFQHNKVFIVKKGGKAVKVLSGSTNFSITGMYVNANHVVVFNDPGIAEVYSNTFEEAWKDKVSEKGFLSSPVSGKLFSFNGKNPAMNISFSPHADGFSLSRLKGIADRVDAEKSSVLFAVMDTDPTVKGPISPALQKLHTRENVFSYGITDSTTDIFLYEPGKAAGVKVTGLPGQTLLPAPFDKEKSITMGHQVHHKFIVCGFNTPDAIVWFGSSNLAQGGEDENGDNLIELKDQDIATVFAIEAFSLVDHFGFRDQYSAKNKTMAPRTIELAADDSWTRKYYDPADLYYKERELF